MNQPLSDDLINLAHRLADASGDVIRRYYRQKIDIVCKSDASPVTQADQEAEQAIRHLLEKERPDDAIHGEEFGTPAKTSNFLWIIDPIDGTKAFATGRPIFGTLIALYHNGIPTLGVIDQPITRERWIGATGYPTTLNGHAVRCRPCASISQAHLATTGPNMFDNFSSFESIAKTSAFTIYGGDCYSYGQLACGFLDSVIEGHMKLHDYAALIPIVKGAGGKITDWHGQPLRLSSESTVIASGDACLHDILCKKLSG